MPTLGESLPGIMSALVAHDEHTAGLGEFDDPFARFVAVVLGWSVEPSRLPRVIGGLDDAGLLEPAALADAEIDEVAAVLKSSGAAVSPRALVPLRRLAHWLVQSHDGRTTDLLDHSVATETLRDELSRIPGIGLATADTILLSALRRPVYPVDRASYRILVRHGWLDVTADYEEARAVVERVCPEEPDGLEQLSHGLERIGRQFCKTGVAKCESCPLRPFLPDGGPVDPS